MSQIPLCGVGCSGMKRVRTRIIFFLHFWFLLFGPVCLAETKVPQTQLEMTISFAPVVKLAAPAVVNIYATIVVESRRNPFESDPFFRDFFQNFGSNQPKVQNSLGSGVILTTDGIVVSNYHVVAGATDIRVVLKDGREYFASPLLWDRDSDLAVLKLDDARDMPHLQFRDSNTVEVGELVLAIGNPFGIGQTVSSGIVSGLARSGTARGDGQGYFIQTDAAINPGNSGGPLIDMAGRLIGINTSILTRSGGSNGIGFAIPAGLVRQFVTQAQEGKTTFERPWVGLSGQALTSELASSLGLRYLNAMVITAIHPQSPFQKADFKVGDVISAVDGNAVSNPAELLYRLSVIGLGGLVQVTKQTRDGELNVGVALMAAPDLPSRRITRFNNRSYFPGLVLSSINPAVAEEFDLPWDIKGLVVLDSGRVASSIGLRKRDIIISANGQKLTTASAIDHILETGGRSGMLLVQRGTQRISLRFRR